MKEYGKINSNGVFISAPVNFITPDGKPVLNFCSSVKLMTEYGFKPVESEEEPEVDGAHIAVPVYQDMGSVIRRSWSVELADEEE